MSKSLKCDPQETRGAVETAIVTENADGISVDIVALSGSTKARHNFARDAKISDLVSKIIDSFHVAEVKGDDGEAVSHEDALGRWKRVTLFRKKARGEIFQNTVPSSILFPEDFCLATANLYITGLATSLASGALVTQAPPC